ncbi:uncharacterized protein LOC124862902 isoform X2 [Girardinichthys multiradiatus]|uniref:uncharacterized protein LOC124862902 isoform X2 n=1 Tax=Girardinichthys multiradiatus TaxID=208333 RepID=UPI001FAD4164|nr:uncharacterized protein LOC124862902 isoform X2 [Girardinichthys multiradiatus]
MSFQILLRITSLILLECVRHTSGTSGCLLENTTCTDIRVAEGFRFKHQCPEGSEISVEATDKTHLAMADLRKQSFSHVADIVKMDNHSVITKTCQDLIFTCTIVTENLVHLGEKCVNIKTSSAWNASLFQPDDFSLRPEYIAAIPIFVFSALLLISYCCWKKEQGRVIFHSVPRNQEGSGFPMVGTRDLAGQHNGDIRNGRDPRGSGETDQHTLESVISFRNMREDPGGINGTAGREIKRELDGGGAAPHRQAEEQPLLPDQRAASEGLDMAGEAVALVNELSIDQDRISRCSAAPDTDVESIRCGNPTSKI